MLFGKKNNAVPAAGEADKILERITAIAQGDFTRAEAADFEDPIAAERINALIDSIFEGNNRLVMKLNAAMQQIGDSSCVKEMIGQVDSQASSIESMESACASIDASITHISDKVSDIRENSHAALTSSEESVAAMRHSIETVSDACTRFEKLNVQFENLNAKIDRINEITDIVSSIAGKSSLLALNASIEAARAGEAGRGFSVVAANMQELAKNTASSTADVTRYVGEIRESMAELTAAIGTTTADISQGNEMVQASVEGVQNMAEQLKSISGAIDEIFTEVNGQQELNSTLTGAVTAISDSYKTLSGECFTTGEHLYKISRLIDKIRSDTAKKNVSLTEQDWITIFEIDHLIFTWRQYNNLVGYEVLNIGQINNPDGCKLGKWIARQTDPAIRNSAAYRKVKDAHTALHKYSVDCFNASAEGRKDEALRAFDMIYAAYERLLPALDELRGVLRAAGYEEITQV